MDSEGASAAVSCGEKRPPKQPELSLAPPDLASPFQNHGRADDWLLPLRRKPAISGGPISSSELVRKPRCEQNSVRKVSQLQRRLAYKQNLAPMLDFSRFPNTVRIMVVPGSDFKGFLPII